MMSADELFSKGRLLPYKGSNKSQIQSGTTTLRDELFVEDREDDVSFRPPKGSSTRWKGLLGPKRTAHIGSKKAERGSDGSSMEGRRSGLVHESSSSQEVLNEEGQLGGGLRLEYNGGIEYC